MELARACRLLSAELRREPILDLLARLAVQISGASRARVLVGDIGKDSGDREGSSSAWSCRVPIASGERVFGSLAVESDGEPLPTRAMANLRRLTAQASISLENARLVGGLVEEEHVARAAEADLRASIDEVADLYNRAPCGYHSLDETGLIVRMNDTELDWLGYTREEVVGKLRMNAVLTPASLRSFEVAFSAFKERGWAKDLDVELIRKDGSVLPVLVSATAIYDDAGRFVMSRSTVVDMADRRRIEERLRSSLTEASDLYDHAPCGYHSLDARGAFVRVNETELRWLGYEREELLGKTLFRDLMTQESRRMFEAVWPDLVTGDGEHSGLEYDLIRKDGTVLSVLLNARAVRDEVGRFVRSRASLHDVTERRRVEAALRRTEQFIRRVADATPDVIYVFDLAKGRLVYGNREVSKTLGFTAEQVEDFGDRVFDELLHPDDFVLTRSRSERFREAKDWDVIESKFRLRNASGEWRWLHARNVVFDRGAAGEPTRFLGIAQDVTERKKAEEALRVSTARLEAVSRRVVEVQEEERRHLAR